MKATRIIGGIFLVLIAGVVFAQGIPQLINYQGRLTDDTGLPVDGTTVDMEFSIWDKEITVESVIDESAIMNGTSPIALSHQDLVPGTEVVTAVGGVPTYETPRDYLMDYINGTITRVPTGFILDGQEVEVDYDWTDYGSQLWSEPQAGVLVTGGIYNVILGSVNPIAPSFLSGSMLYFEMKVEGETLLPRSLLTSVPFAHKAASVPDSSITSAMIADGTITGSDIDLQTITGSNIADETITSTQIQDLSIAGSDLQNDSLGTDQIQDIYVLNTGDTVTGDLQVDGNEYVGLDLTVTGGNIGLGTAPDALYGIVNDSFFAPDYGAYLFGATRGIQAFWSPNMGVHYAYLASQNYGVYARSGNSGETGNMYGGQFSGYSDDSATGVSGQAFGFGTQSAYGIQGFAANYSSGPAVGGYFDAVDLGTGTHYGVYSSATSSSPIAAYGVYGVGINSLTGPAYGGYFITASSGTGPHYGVHGYGLGNSASPSCGVTGQAVNISTGDAYGGFFDVSVSGTGIHYGIYASAEDYAGWFQGGQVHIGDAGTVDYLDSDGDLYVEDALEVDGAAYFSGGLEAPGAIDASDVNFNYAGSTSPGGAAIDLDCADCVDGTEVAFNYAGSASEGGAASDLSCTDCVSASEAEFNYAGSTSEGGAATDLSCIDCLNVTEIEDIYVLNSGDTMYGDLTLSSSDLLLPDSSSQIRFTHASSGYLMNVENSTNSGIYYDATNNYWSWIQSGITRGRIDLDNGYLEASQFRDMDNASYYLDPSSMTSGRMYGNLQIGNGSPSDDDNIYFDQNSEYLRWEDANARFSFSDDISAESFYDFNNTTYYLDPSALTSGRMYGNFQIGYGSSSDDDYLYFDQNSEYLSWTNAATEFYLTDDLHVSGDMIVTGGDVYNDSAYLMISADDNVYVVMDNNNDDPDTRAIIFGKNSRSAPTEIMRIQENGNVGIGTTVPGAKLDIRSSGTGDILNLYDGATEVVTVIDGGNVGIKTTTPGATLDIRNSGTEDILNIYDGASEVMTVIDGGNVGIGTNSPGYQLEVRTSDQERAIVGINTRAGVGNSGIYGAAVAGYDEQIGVRGYAYIYSALDYDGYGVYGEADCDDSAGSGVDGYGGYFRAYANGFAYGVYAYADSDNASTYGIFASTGGGPDPYAGYFSGDVHVSGSLSKGMGSFKIDHPLDPENKYLMHSFVESPDMMNVYNGNVLLDSNGEAWVELPEWFEALNRDFRYQLTCIGGFAPVYVQEEISGNQFKIAGGEPGMKVSWQVTGIRQDAFAEANRIQVEVEKSEEDKGKYIHPEVFGKAEELGIDYKHKVKHKDKEKKSSD